MKTKEFVGADYWIAAVTKAVHTKEDEHGLGSVKTQAA